MRAFAAITLSFMFVVGCTTSARANFIYGITTDGIIYEISIVNSSTTQVLVTNINHTNGLAFDEANTRLFFRSGTASNLTGNNNLYVWNRTGNAIQVAVPTNINGGVLPFAATGGSFYNNSYWYVGQTTDTLYRVNFDFSNAAAPTVSSLNTFLNFDGVAGFTNYGFDGDISIRPNGLLYASGKRNGTGSGQKFFRVDVSGASPTGYTELASGGSALQLGFASDGVTLYGQHASTGNWFTINPASGAETALGFSSLPVRFLDMSEGSATSAIPESGAMVTSGIFLTGLALLTARRRRRTPASSERI